DKVSGVAIRTVGSGFGATLSDTVTTIHFNTALTTIEQGAFQGKSHLTTIVFGTQDVSELVSIGASAFEGSGVTALSINSKALDVIGARAFVNTALISVDLTLVKSIGDYAFAKMEGDKVVADDALTHVDITVARGGKVGRYALAYKTALTAVNLKGSIAELGEGAFARSDLSATAEGMLSNEIATIGAFAFADTKIKLVPNLAKVVGDYAFARGLVGLGGSALTLPYDSTVYATSFDGTVTLDNVSLTQALSLGDGAFAGTSLRLLSLGAVQSIARSRFEAGNLVYGSFENTPKLQYVSIDGSDDYFVVKGAIFWVDDWSDHAYLIKMPEDIAHYSRAASMFGLTGVGTVIGLSSSEAVEVDAITVSARAFAGSGVQYVILGYRYQDIEEEAFENCTSLVYVNAKYVTSIGARAFKGCTALSDCDGSGSIVDGKYVCDHDSVWCQYLNTVYPAGHAAYHGIETGNVLTFIGDGAFEGCTALTSVGGIMGNSLTIGARAFYNTGIRVLFLPACTTSIGNDAFGNSAGELVEVVVNSLYSVASVGVNPFGTSAKVYYVHKITGDEDLNGAPEAFVDQFRSTAGYTFVGYTSWAHFEVSGGEVVSLKTACNNHNNQHSGETLTVCKYYTDGTVITSVSDSITSCTVVIG
ncbi:MAG: leucine-rich repeat protein, partial [Clostridia bacterium]|nr:leucine-rich repeat protein [Clostridia bacterium]